MLTKTSMFILTQLVDEEVPLNGLTLSKDSYTLFHSFGNGFNETSNPTQYFSCLAIV
jgi:hypothetical protein